MASVPLDAAQPVSASIEGRVLDETGGALPGVTITLSTAAGPAVASAVSGPDGTYRIDGLAAGACAAEFRLANFAMVRRTLTVSAGTIGRADVTLRLTLSADVAVTGPRTFRNLADLPAAEGSLIGVADAASEGLVSAHQIETRPIMRAGEVLETVPGVVISQHSGEGKANQYYLRGFNLDHGTDFATTVAGVPVNLPTHAHGHGYADLNFLIPELVSAVQFRKGPYFADEGDFATAGAAHIRYVNALDRPIVRLGGGEDGWGRTLAAASPRLGAGRLLAAAELARNDGPWARGDDYRRLNGVVRYSVGDTLNGWSATAMGYDGTWQSTDQVPVRAVASGAMPRFGAVDDTTGGSTRRASLSADWQRTRPGGVTRANTYLLRYELDLYSNFTYFLDDPVNGDQFQQTDRRWTSGGRLSHRVVSRIGARPAELLLGGELRHDAIGRVALLHTVRRQPISVTRDDQVNQTSVAGFAQHEVQWTPWLRSNAGLRVDRFHFNVAAGLADNSGTAGRTLASPKGSLILGPWRWTEVYVNAGAGFHSNDARGTTIRVDPESGEPVERVTPLARARGAEVGARFAGLRGLETDITLWRLDLDAELLFVGDAGTTASSRPSRRWGVEWNTYARPRPWLTLDADLAWSKARFSDGDPAGDRVPGAIERVASAGITFDTGARAFGSLRLRYFGPRDLVEDGRVRSSSTRLVNAQAGARLSRQTEIVLDAFNLFDAEASDIDYFYASRLPGEPAEGVEDLHTHPTLPRTIRLSLRWRF